MENYYSLLIVEDNKDELNLLHSYMEKKKIFSTINVASTGNEAVEIAQKVKPDIILLDLILPGGMDGMDVLNSIQSIKPTPKVIVTSGVSFNNMTLQTIQLGAVYYILKPYNLEMVYRRVLSVLNILEEDTIIIKISSYLQLLGISTALNGYYYLRDAILFSIINLEKRYSLKQIYSIISKNRGTSIKSIERAIDNAIDTAMKKNTANTYFDFFGNTINDTRCKPTSREFISMITDKILIENPSYNQEYYNL